MIILFNSYFNSYIFDYKYKMYLKDGFSEIIHKKYGFYSLPDGS